MADLPPEPEKPRGGSDKEYLKWKKSHAEWARMARDAESDPERNEEEAMDRARQRGDSDFADGVEELLGYTLDEVRDALRNTPESEMSIAELEAKRALERADNAWFFKAGAQKDAHKKMKKAKSDIQGRVRKSKCSLFALFGLGIVSFEVYVIASGVSEVFQAMSW
jgi:hypothetical protein